jgi:hypothetical protein
VELTAGLREAPIIALAASLAFGCATDPDAEAVPATVLWMEWPAEVLAAEPFTVRLTGFGVDCREVVRFDTDPTVDDIAITFEPFFVVTGPQQPCPLSAADPIPASASLMPPFFDTRAAVPPLTPTVPRTYEMRAMTLPFQTALGAPDRVIRTFGDVVVRSEVAQPGVTRVGGQVYSYVDTLACVRAAAHGLIAGYVVENPPAGGGYWSGFLRGYLHPVSTPICGETRVLYLESIEE